MAVPLRKCMRVRSIALLMENAGNQPLLSPTLENQNQLHSLPRATTASFVGDADDIPPITGVRDFFGEFCKEFNKLWYLAAPAIFTSVCQYSVGAITQVFTGHVSTIALAAVTIENSVIGGFSIGIMFGMGSALETPCGQAYGVGKLHMLGIYMQRSWIILNSTAVILWFIYLFAQQILRLIGQTAEISKTAGIFAIWMIPQLFAYAFNFPLQKFLQAQSKMTVIALISRPALALNTFFSWFLMLKLGWGLVGAAVSINSSWWFLDIAQLIYIFSGTCGRAWNGFSWRAFQNLWGFVRLSIASAVMLCINILGWTVMAAMGMNAAISVRVSNEPGAAHPRTAQFSLLVAAISSILVGLILSLILFITRNLYPAIFSSDAQVRALVNDLTPLISVSIIANNVQPVLSGVAAGAGWQASVAYANIGCYCIFGIPLGLTLSYKLDFGLRGIWYGMLSGTVLQTIVLFGMVYKTDWNKEASLTEDRTTKFGGHTLNGTEKSERHLEVK